ncbi:hypothetical protein NPIL_138341 [Nephila pilipes]|uniref:Uncharacterized protein n=1 Tax=Nephila pilipes TaxID=299642 RepID=A0A8X6UKX7_NEPPI|nr:hypothetical protein NPIL_138341 [Nephila pilipes]
MIPDDFLLSSTTPLMEAPPPEPPSSASVIDCRLRSWTLISGRGHSSSALHLRGCFNADDSLGPPTLSSSLSGSPFVLLFRKGYVGPGSNLFYLFYLDENS